MGISLSQSANQVEMFYIQSLTFLILLTLSSLCGQVSIQVLIYIEAEKTMKFNTNLRHLSFRICTLYTVLSLPSFQTQTLAS